MKTFILLFLVCGLLITVINGCSNEAKGDDKEEVINAIKKNIQALEDEDITLAKESLHSESPNLDMTISLCEKIFDQYDLHYELVNYNINKINGDEAEVSFEQITKKKSGPAFKDNKITGIHLLKKENGTWKMFTTQIKNIEYLN